jgi:hypothetical protein
MPVIYPVQSVIDKPQSAAIEGLKALNFRKPNPHRLTEPKMGKPEGPPLKSAGSALSEAL